MSAKHPSRATGYVPSDGEDIYYEVTGEGPPIVLCHGLGGNHAIWWRQIEALAERHTLVTWDQRGFGNSSARSGELGPPAARRDLHALLDRLALDRVALVGQSMGGWAVLGYAETSPERVSALILSTTLAGADPAHVRALVTAEVDRDRLNRREHPVLSRAFCAENPDLGVLYNQISSFGTRPDPATILQSMADDQLHLRALERLTMPTLALMASDDILCPPPAMSWVTDRLPRGRMQVIPGGHSAYYETPAIWNGAVLAFLAQAAGGA
ncbi:MAG: alpha/beta hydrolase [Sphingomonas bacterium]|nr:alpha/beta hydrolase [Sphingomonas bacterium]